MSDSAVLNYETPLALDQSKPSGIMRLVGNGFWAIADQGFFAGSNFILNIVLARWLSPNEYGAFGVAFSIFLLVGTLHSSLVTEPMTVFAPGKVRERIQSYLGVCLYGHVAFARAEARPFPRILPRNRTRALGVRTMGGGDAGARLAATPDLLRPAPSMSRSSAKRFIAGADESHTAVNTSQHSAGDHSDTD